MKHPKARNESPEQVRPRIEEARRKVKKSNDTWIEDDDACHPDGVAAADPAFALAFPDFPAMDLSILRALPKDGRETSPTDRLSPRKLK
jgi:hypothetical protein